MMIPSFALAVALLGACVRANGQNGVTFQFPLGGETFYTTDVVNVTYTSPFSAPHLILWCNTKGSAGPKEYFRTSNAPGPNASMLVAMNLTVVVESCWFNLRPVANYDNGYTGPKGDNCDPFVVKVAEANRAPATISLPQTTEAPKATNAGTLTFPTSTQSPSTTGTGTGASGQSGQSNVPSVKDEQPASTSSGGGLSTGAVVGLAVGLALLAAIVAGGACVACWLRRQKKRKLAAQTADYQYPNDKIQPPSTADPSGYQSSPYQSTMSPTSPTPQMLSDSYAESQWQAGASPPTYHGQPHGQSPVLAQKSPGTASVSELHSPAGTAELPTRGLHGYGHEHEMAAHEAKPHLATQPSSRGDSEGKFLLQDVLTTKLHQQPAAELDSMQITPPARPS